MGTLPWYRQAWPWALIAIPLSAVLLGIVMVAIATGNPDDLVADDYYKEGMAINERLTRDNHAARMGIHGRLADKGPKALRFEFTGADDSAVVFHLYHVIDRKKDRRIILYPDDRPGFYSTNNAEVIRLFAGEGVWYLEFEGVEANWRLRKRVELPVKELEVGH